MKFKRFLALALSLLMVFGGAASIFADETTAATTEAEEVAAVSPYQAAIDALKTLNIFKGDENGDSTEKAITRWQMSLFVSRSLTGETDDAYWGKTAYDYSKFTDVTGTSSLYLGAIGFANQKGIILGYNDATTGKAIFNPDGGITYQDALTMATRTLGFTGLSYPWGNIEKAIDLGLTKGIVDVGYQDELNRGEVAQIVYNMLIAKVLGADGKYWTLKDKAFGIQESVVVIVAGDQNKYDTDKEVLKRDNYVSFQILGDDGKVTKPVYSISAAAFGIGADEDPDSYIGYSYSVATSDEFASFVSCEINPTVTYWNNGKTTKGTEFTATKFNEGKPNEYTKLVIVNAEDAKDTTDNYSIVENYTTLRTIQGAKTGVEKIPGDSELLVYDPYVRTEIVTKEGEGYYTDAFGNILTAEKVFDVTLGKEVYKLLIKYYYNDFTKSYYEKRDGSVINATSTVTGQTITYDWAYVPVSADTIAKIKVGRETAKVWSFAQKTALSDLSNTYAYSSLTLIDDYRAYEGFDRAIYKAYGLGKVVTTDKDGDTLLTKVKVPTGTVGELTDDMGKGAVNVKADTKVKFVDAITGKSIDTPKDGAWVLFKYDGARNVVEVLETLTLESGVLNGWSIPNKTVTIGNEKYPANYETLLNNGIKYDSDGRKTTNNNKFYDLYRRSVKYIVLDGDVVWVENNAVTSKGVVVLDRFLGITTDGMLEYYAYTTNVPGSLQKIRVNAVNNWYFGSYASAYSNAYASLFGNLGASSVKGQKFAIAAIDDAGVYYLTDATSAELSMVFNTYNKITFEKVASATPTNLPALNGGDATSLVTIDAKTYYVFINNNAQTNDGNVITTATGIPGDYGFEIEGKIYWATSSMIIVDISDYSASVANVKEYFNTTANIAYYYYPTANTPEGITGLDAVGNAVITYSGLINLATGGTTDKVTTNDRLIPGYTYIAKDGVVQSKVAVNVWPKVAAEYTLSSVLSNNKEFKYGSFTLDYTPNNTESLDKQFEAMRTAILAKVDASNGTVVASNVKDLTLRKLTIKDSGEIKVSTDTNGKVIDFSNVSMRYTIEYFYNNYTGKVAAYIVGDVVPTPASVINSTLVAGSINKTVATRTDLVTKTNTGYTVTFNYLLTGTVTPKTNYTTNYELDLYFVGENGTVVPVSATPISSSEMGSSPLAGTYEATTSMRTDIFSITSSAGLFVKGNYILQITDRASGTLVNEYFFTVPANQ